LSDWMPTDFWDPISAPSTGWSWAYWSRVKWTCILAPMCGDFPRLSDFMRVLGALGAPPWPPPKTPPTVGREMYPSHSLSARPGAPRFPGKTPLSGSGPISTDLALLVPHCDDSGARVPP